MLEIFKILIEFQTFPKLHSFHVWKLNHSLFPIVNFQQFHIFRIEDGAPCHILTDNIFW